MYKLIIVILVLFTINCEANELDYNLIEKNLIKYEKKINALQENIDNSVFNSEEIILKQEFDSEKLIAFIQDKFVFQPYVGLLRGIQGTLNSRSGNAIDQAVLLAKLLGDAGFETRIAQGILTDEQSLQLISGIAKASIPSHIGNSEEFKQAISALSNSNDSTTTMNWKDTQTYARYKKSLNTLEVLLDKYNIRLRNTDITKKLIEQSKDYFWVEYRMSPTEKWKSAHPAFKKDNPVNVDALSYFKNKVPEKYLHQVKIEAFIQQRVGNKFKTHRLMKAWQKPSANLQNTLISYSNIPSGVNVNSNYDLKKILNNTNYFVPNFNGSAVGGKIFDLKGRLIDSMGMNSPAGALFKTLGDKTLSAIDKIEQREDGKSNMQLTAQWLQFTFIHPDGSEFTQKRYIYQAQEDNTSDMDIKTQLISEYSILTSTGEYPLSYMAKVYLDAVESGLPLLKASSRKLFQGEVKTAFPKSTPESEFNLLTQYYWIDNHPDLSEQTIRFRSTPNLLSFKRGFVNFEKAFFAVDVISNKQEFIQRHGNNYFMAQHEAFKQGVWDTASEWLPARFLKLEGNKVDTLKITNAAMNQNIALTAIKTEMPDLNTIKSVSQNKMAENRMLSDLNLGYTIITPKQTPNDISMSGWWRINPKTGETLGMTADGGGQDVTEAIIETTAISLMLVRALHNLQKCEMDDKLNNYEKMCCMAEAHLNNVIGLSFGGALGKAVGTAGAAVFDIADFTTELVTGALNGPENARGLAPSTNGEICKKIGPIPTF